MKEVLGGRALKTNLRRGRIATRPPFPSPTSSLRPAAYSLRVALLALAIACGSQVAAAAESPADTIYRANEAQRIGAIDRQLELNNWLIWQSGYGPWDANPRAPFPRVPRTPWAALRSPPVEQPTGHQSLQTGPDRWIYRPVYAQWLPRATGTTVTDNESTDDVKRTVEPPRPPAPGDQSIPPRPGPRDATERPAGPRAF